MCPSQNQNAWWVLGGVVTSGAGSCGVSRFIIPPATLPACPGTSEAAQPQLRFMALANHATPLMVLQAVRSISNPALNLAKSHSSDDGLLTTARQGSRSRPVSQLTARASVQPLHLSKHVHPPSPVCRLCAAWAMGDLTTATGRA